MIKGEINSSKASLNVLPSAPLRQHVQEEIIFTRQFTSEEINGANNAAVEKIVTECYSRIKKRMRYRSSNIL